VVIHPLQNILAPQSVLILVAPAGSTFGEFGAPGHMPSIRATLGSSRINWKLSRDPDVGFLKTGRLSPPSSPRECNPRRTQIVKHSPCSWDSRRWQCPTATPHDLIQEHASMEARVKGRQFQTSDYP
jgi:hypothetical protein